ncbi:hypothetical protein [Pontimicrobium sp. SW4]|uniref:Uncharacterized protein n=1 Tax=Pontimicrobium sp. SW4 TaxID=3153519 RepID=A0AAU7BUG9_9FLAO
MKKIYLLLTFFLCTISLFAQTPQKMNYQAVIRNSSDMVVANQAIGIQISILQTSPTGSAVYVETQNPTTNANGLISIEIGSGSVVSGNFATIGWSSDTYYIKTEVDTAGGTSYTITGTSQLMSVPYALHAKTAETVASITESDPIFGASPANGITNTDITNWNSKLANTLADTNILVGNGSNEATAVAVSGDATLANDGTLTIADNAIDGTDISLTGEAAGDMAYFNGTDWIRLPKGTANQSLVMNSGATAPEWQSGGATEDVEVILGSATGGSGTSIAIPANVIDYEYIRLETDNWDIASNLHAVHGTVLVSDMASKRILIYADTVYYLHADINASGTSLTINCSGTATWRIVGIKAQKTVLDPSLTTVIDDDTFATASSSNVPSAESVKAYVDSHTSTAYSTAEQLTGRTWIDGKPIYERSFAGNYNASINILTGVDKIITSNISVRYNGSSDWYSGTTSTDDVALIKRATGNVNIAGSGGFNTNDYIIVVTYTKL